MVASVSNGYTDGWDGAFASHHSDLVHQRIWLTAYGWFDQVIVARKFHIGQLVATGQEPEAVFHNFLSKKGVISARSNDHCRK